MHVCMHVCVCVYGLRPHLPIDGSLGYEHAQKELNEAVEQLETHIGRNLLAPLKEMPRLNVIWLQPHKASTKLGWEQ